jgi:predicted CXXCH cytochrome family protein
VVTVGVPRRSIFVLALLALVFAGTGATPAEAAEPSSQQGGAVGSAVCAGCHPTHAERVELTPHAAPGIGESCEGCHGGGGAHVSAMVSATTPAAVDVGRSLIFSFDQSPSENAQRCLDCHEGNRETQHFDHSEHQLNGVACQNCHSPHLIDASSNAQGSGLALLIQRDFAANVPLRREEDRWLNDRLLRESQPQLCFGCHATIESQFSLPTHHPVTEGLVACTDCHNPHGSRNLLMLRNQNSETCVACHAEKRGPFVFEHAPVEVEGCTSCHTPHGSVNRMLLLRREDRFLCLQCHVNPFAPNVPHGRLGFQTSGDCTRCHVAVHGSNSSPYLLD